MTSITVADIAFSIDSILAAVGMAEGFPAHFGDWGKFSIVLIGGVLGIITMRFVVRYFLILLERFPGLEEGAYYLVAWIGLKLLLSGYHQFMSGIPQLKHLAFHIPEPLFWVVMLLIAGASLVVKPRARPGAEAELAETRDLLESARKLRRGAGRRPLIKQRDHQPKPAPGMSLTGYARHRSAWTSKANSRQSIHLVIGEHGAKLL